MRAGKLNGGNNPLNPYVNGDVNASDVAQQLVQAGTAATGLARCGRLGHHTHARISAMASNDLCITCKGQAHAACRGGLVRVNSILRRRNLLWEP